MRRSCADHNGELQSAPCSPLLQGVPQASKASAYQQRKTEQDDASNREHLDLLGKSETGEMMV